MISNQAEQVVARLRARSATVASAESLTAGLLCARLVDVTGASDVVRGAVVAYATDLKSTLLGVQPATLARDGAVSESTARAMATGVRERLGATYGISTTGVAGPGSDPARPAGTVHVAVAGPRRVAHRLLHLDGDRAVVRETSVSGALELLLDVLEEG
ncbi:MAG: nicotinamide-nucleotide amidohydrolase family protein [Nocardioidaceae bacterium]|jgi:PncC family amidohydrolase|nr:nicotinamide-nucleotide amidohydrolase family protein [Nocardioidaceae bacterium]